MSGTMTSESKYSAPEIAQRQLGLLIPGLGTTEIFEVICGELAGLARVHEYSLIWGGSTHPRMHADACIEDTYELCTQFIRREVSGVFFAPFERIDQRDEVNRRLAESLRQAGIAVVLLDRDLGSSLSRSEFDLVGIDNFAGGYLLADHLLKLGCRHLAFVARPLSAPTVNARLAGAREAILDHGLPIPPDFLHLGEPDDPELVRRLISARPVDATICANDYTAAMLLRPLENAGIRVPHDMRVVGFDDVRSAMLFSVPLTTMHQPCREIAVTAFHAMLERIADPALPPRSLTLSPRLVVRESCGAYLASDLERLASSERQARMEIQKAHDQLKTTQSQLVQEEKHAALSRLVAGVAHEINNPLAFVINNIAVLLRDVGELRDLLRLYREADETLLEHRPEVFQRIRLFNDRIDVDYTLDNLEGMMVRAGEGLRRIQQIVKELRDFARLDEGDLKEADLNAGIHLVIHLLHGEADSKQVTLDEALSPMPGVTCYPAEINQVVLNLVTNAIEVCRAGGKVTVQTCSGPDGVEIHVSDTGHGIDPAIRDKIFDPFFTTKPVGAGRGLGLSISHGIVAEHGGRIEVDSTPGQGAHFTVHLPLTPSLAADARRRAKAAGVAVEMTRADSHWNQNIS
jgi:LacI family transcriptional regulator